MMKLLTTVTGRHILFNLSVEPGSRVSVAGTFNDWNPDASPMKDNPGSGHCKATLFIPTGVHEYKFVVDGEWLTDPNCKESVTNDCGSMNSVLRVVMLGKRKDA
ncbi:MAG: glycogen-binding domain-containing protein [Victivallales bacterium]|nr:glycogen-binding domain-containing protein [Victivallales bacterium]